ncbi:uroporphyrinogen-III synthase [Capnocytophaga felis]|uniref:Uroporphyrinogen III methyltransferase n=1 Tax=Capnocytophaga felis TaxID=2267611 RepID=A0A5M4B788_9FLAO|nr:uroporphyrinogen-III synthase [Capnocytophaga felis]GET45145.1 uroporphyrinogen III methyltransferase [Capnocytophaga felis]GET47691.1 uroporphyrinogen III methyltransferase [Capnocytophaga felis]
MKVKTILVSQPEPKMEGSPYAQIIENQKVKIDFIPFIKVEGMTAKDIRMQKIDLTKFSAIILTSRKSVDHYFRIAEEMRFKVPDTMKYFCQSETIAFYLQKYITYRKRKIYVGKKEFSDLLPILKKYKDENFLFPGSDIQKPEITKALNDLKIKWERATFYKTVHCDLSGIKDFKYDILAFFSPAGIESLFKNFPDFSQKKTRIAVYGDSTLKAAEEAGLVIDIKAPSPETPSMTMALEQYISKVNGKK